MTKADTTHQNRQIVGFSLPPELAQAVKQEAASKSLSLRNLFVEMWEAYKAKSGAKV